MKKKVTSYDKIFNEAEKEKIRKDYIENGLSIRKLSQKYNINSKEWIKKVLTGIIRNYSEANRNAHKLYPNCFKHSDATKQLLRQKRLNFMKQNPEKTAWRRINISYPESMFQKILENSGLDKKYLIYREYSVFPYFIDFAFVNEKIAVEIDGSQHLENDRKRRDDKKDTLLLSNGWRVLRITAFEVIHNKEKVLNSLFEMLGNKQVNYTKVGILKAPKTREKAVRGEDGLTEKQRESAYNRRIVERPSKEELLELIKSKAFTAIAKEYGVSDKAITKWCKAYNLPSRKKDLKLSSLKY